MSFTMSTAPAGAFAARTPRARGPAFSRLVLLRLAALTPAVLLIHGYHPFADDAEIYVAGVRKLLDPSPYQVDAPFVLASTHLSVFARLLAGAVRLTHLPLTWVLLAAHLTSILLYLLAVWLVARAIFAREAECWAAVLFSAACFTLPAAGTALVIMDPYVTARSFSTPLALFSVAAVLRRRWGWTAGLLVIMVALHPLMALYAAALVILYAAVDSGRARDAAGLAVAGVMLIGVIATALRHHPVSHAYVEVMRSPARAFLYPSEWRWYENIGIIAPLMLFGLAAFRAKKGGLAGKLCLTCLLLGTSCAVAAFLFVHPSGPYLLVRVQLLRSFHILYALGVLLLGGWLGARLGHKWRARWVLYMALAAAAAGLFAAQKATYPESAHVEWPWVAAPHNPWVQAYVWIRRNTPADAVFAAAPNLIFQDGVDQQGFRARTERSLLADNKDQGAVAVMAPSLAAEWAAQRDAQIGVDGMTDAERERRLRPFGVTWLLLRANSVTGFACPYRNAVAKVCMLK